MDKLWQGLRGGKWMAVTVINALDEAVNILEGNTGLLWLLAIGLLILLTT